MNNNTTPIQYRREERDLKREGITESKRRIQKWKTKGRGERIVYKTLNKLLVFIEEVIVVLGQT